MNAQIALMSMSCLFSVMTVGLLYLSGLPPLATVLVSSGAALFGASAILSRFLQAKPKTTEFMPVGAGKNPESIVAHEVPALLKALEKKLSESRALKHEILEYPIVTDIFSSKDGGELAERISRAHQRIVVSEQILSVLSDSLLTDSLILLPLADAIIKSVPGRCEDAVMHVLDNFMVVREASSHAAESARSLREKLDDSSSEASIGFAAERSRTAVRNERSVIRELSQATKENRENLQAMSSEVEAGLALLKNISEITERSKLIAFNMSIEAARMGEKGRGFKVIIVELHRLNEQTFEFSKQVANLLKHIRDYTTALVSTMEQKSVAVVSEVEKGMDAAEGSVESLIDASSRTEAFTKEIALMSESIDHDLDGVLESLQFQDITRQMIEGALDILGELQASLNECLSRNDIKIDETRKRERFNSIRDRLIGNAKTKGEKTALMEVRI
jgi:hypothetical protein